MSRLRAVAALAGACAAALLAAGFAAADQTAWTVVAAATAGAWAIAATIRIPAAPLACLATALVLAVAGLRAGAPAPLVGLGAATSIAAWDLALFARGWAWDGGSGDPAPLLRARAVALAAGLAPGLALAVLLRLVHVRLPLLGVMVAGAVLLHALYRVAQALRTES